MKTCFKILSIIIAVICICPDHAVSDDITNTSTNITEGIYQIRYSMAVSKSIQVIIKDTNVFLPLVEILNELKICNKYDPIKKYISGFYISPDSLYFIDFEKNYAKYNNNSFQLDSRDYLVSDVDVYVKSSFFKQLFNLGVNTYPNLLLVMVSDAVELPVLSDIKRSSRNDVNINNYDDSYYPLRIDRERSLLNGAMMDYDIIATRYKEISTYGYNLDYGMELLGGDFQVVSNGYWNPGTQYNYLNNEYRWRYYFNDNPYLTQVAVGNLYNLNYRISTLPYQQIRGIQISNELTRMPSKFTNNEIVEKADPGTQVELWVDGNLAQHEVADESGIVRFNYPLRYGVNSMSLRFYGIHGEFKEMKDYWQIPSEFVQPGDIRYSLTAGEKIYNSEKTAEGRLYIGITDWLTNSISVEKSFTYNSINYYNSLNILLGESVTSCLDYSNKLWKANVKGMFNSFGDYNLTFTRYHGYSDLNQSGLLNSINSYFTIPRLFTLPLFLNFFGNGMEYPTYYFINASSTLNLNIYPLMLEGGYNVIGMKYKSGGTYADNYLSLNTYYNLFSGTGYGSIFSGTRLKASADYSVNYKKIETASCGLDQKLFDAALFRLELKRDFTNHYTYANITMSIDFRNVRSETNYKVNNSDAGVYTQTFQGNVGLNSHLMKLNFNNPKLYSSVGVGAASVRFYIDENDNGQYDKGEEIIKGVKFSIPNAMVDKNSNEESNAYNLIPYCKYNIVVEQSSFKNPLLLPTSSKFSFVADPNSYKLIDIPCYAAGVVEGAVVGDNQKPLNNGVKIHIISTDSSYDKVIPVFRDGTFYNMGVPPGKYIAFVDSLQLKVLGYESNPSSINFNVRRTADGDYIEGLNFVLTSKKNMVLINK